MRPRQSLTPQRSLGKHTRHMCAAAIHENLTGAYRGALSDAFSAFLEPLGKLPSLLTSSQSELLSDGADKVYRLRVQHAGQTRELAVKQYGRQSRFKDLSDKRIATEAERSWKIANAFIDRGIGTALPAGFLERWDGNRIVECYYLTNFDEAAVSFRNELIRLYRHEPDCEKIINLITVVARAVRQLHDQGVAHRDMGNQNILLHRIGEREWTNVQFIDLNRARVAEELTRSARALDLSRIHLPSDLLRIFFEEYFQGRPPKAFLRHERIHRMYFVWHTRSRRWRHPIRYARERKREVDESVTYPALTDIWIWDERSAQAISTMRGKERRRRYPTRNYLHALTGTLSGAWQVRQAYRALIAGSFASPVQMQNRIGISIDPRPDTADREKELLEELGRIPVLIRFYHHHGRAGWDFTADQVRKLHGAGFPVSIALVQDRKAVVQTGAWELFSSYVVGRVADCVEAVEVGHAMNRLKWGIWTYDEYLHLLDTTLKLKLDHPAIRIMGPSVIDFEHHHLMALFHRMRKSESLDALSHHLCVDRRGAPENRQGPFSTLEKLALTRAIARWAPACRERVVISEVNWPLEGTGVYSPVCSPYLFSGQVVRHPNVSEKTYAEYMPRYYLIALCSGLADQVFWWRLVSRGFGLVDDLDTHWRKRPAFGALRIFISLLGESTFQRKLEAPDGVHFYHFSRPDGEQLVAAYTEQSSIRVQPAFTYSAITSGSDEAQIREDGGVTLSGLPCYFRGVEHIPSAISE